MAFRSTSVTLHESISKEIRQGQGIYFTPAAVRNRLFELLAPSLPAASATPFNVLEPSFGSGEFLFDVLEKIPSAQLYGNELNPTIFKETQRCVGTLSTTHRSRVRHLVRSDFLTSPATLKMDLIIGNPPYFTTPIKDPRCVKGRSNIFILFLYKCLTEHLAPGGLLAFVLPTSLYNCTYYNPCRAYMRDNTTLLAVETIPGSTAGFYETAQDTALIVLRNTPPTVSPPPYILSIPETDTVYITPHAEGLCELMASGTTLRALGCAVKTGEVVWNQHKEKLTHAPPPSSVLVIYANNIKDNALTLGAPGKDKKQYITGFTGKSPTIGPAIVVARGYGNTAYNLKYAVVPAGTVFYGENHVNVITGPAALIPTIAASLSDSRTAAFLEMFVGNGALSKTELENILPVWIA